jgi:hypothetical protein
LKDDVIDMSAPYISLQEAIDKAPQLEPTMYFGDDGVFIGTKFTYVITKDGDIRVGSHKGIHHHDIARGENVFGAGELHFDDKGVLIIIDDESGHYIPTGSEYFPYMKYLVQEQGVSIPPTVVWDSR